MPWHYAEGRVKTGPVEEADFRALLDEGKITADTLVWRPGMAAWQPYHEVADGTYPRAKRACVVCGGGFAPDDLVDILGAQVCARCKPAAVEQVRIGVPLRGLLEYGGFWIRFAAKFLDGILLYAFNMILQALAAAVGLALGEVAGVVAWGVVFLLQFMVPIVYTTFFVGRYGATLGKMVCSLRIVGPQGERITYLRAFARYFAEMLSSLTLMIGYIMAAFDEEKRALHDHVCATRVVRVRRGREAN
ncbi:MAG: RDD family protein [Candidatus Hydrogenedentes bacterium]|nr:RDD family protein [Candidatus Hydrogenedentota bacterium]